MTPSFPVVFVIVLVAWLGTLAALLAEHAYWRHWREWKRYVLGTATLCAACSLVGALLDNPPLAIVPWVLATAGAPIIYLYQHEDPAEAAARRGQKRAALHRLTQNYIDLTERQRRESPLDETGRDN